MQTNIVKQPVITLLGDLKPGDIFHICGCPEFEYIFVDENNHQVKLDYSNLGKHEKRIVVLNTRHSKLNSCGRNVEVVKVGELKG